MNNRWLLILLVLLSGCQLNESLLDSSLTGGPALHAFSRTDGIDLVWNNYILPYFVPSNKSKNAPVVYHVLASEIGPEELSRIAEVTGNTFQFYSLNETPYWFAVEAEYENGSTTRSNIVMSSSSVAQVTAIVALESAEFSANYSELASGFPLFEQMNSQGVIEINSITSSGAATTITRGRSPAPHPTLNQFIYLSAPDNLSNSSGSANSLLLWNLNDSSVTPLVIGAGYAGNPSWSREGDQIVYVSSSVPEGSTSARIIHLDSNSITTNIVTSGNNRYSGGGIDGPNYPSFFPDGEGVAMDVPSIDNGTIGRNIILTFLDGRTDSLLVQSPWMDTQPAVHRDGRTMVFVSDRGGSPAIWELTFSSGRLRQLSGKTTDPVISRDYPLSWSPDGKILWFSGIKAGKTACYQITF